MLASQTHAETNRLTLPGLYSATVEAAQGQDLTQGCIKVSVPAVFGQSREPFPIARPCFPYGHFFVPEKGDRVWVAFEHGNPNDPVWLGAWYPTGKVIQDAEKKPSDQAQPLKRVVRSAKGHVVVMDDKDNKITLQHGNGSAKIVLTKDSLELSFGDSKITLTAGNITIHSKQIDLNTK